MICTSCGQESPAASRYCGTCGALLTGSPPDVRKTVTVVFCDLVGPTALGETQDPEVLRELMTRYHAELRAILERHGGTVEKFVGDAAMAIFGLPQVHEDDALRAVRAAVEMRDAVSALGLQIHVGIDTGEIVAGSGETLATGDAVNVAARLEQTAAAAEVLIGAATERLVREAVRAGAVEPLALKGKSEPVPAFCLLELLDAVPAYTHRIDAPFVGREEELEKLRNALATSVETRTPQLARIVGPPGIGKSRLARELLGRVEARVVVGRCLPYGEAITYWPLQEIASQVGDLRPHPSVRSRCRAHRDPDRGRAPRDRHARVARGDRLGHPPAARDGGVDRGTRRRVRRHPLGRACISRPDRVRRRVRDRRPALHPLHRPT